MNPHDSNTTPVAIVTGASRGFGLAAAHSLLEDGWLLVVDGRNGEDLGTALDGLGSPASIVGIPGDITDATHRRALVEAAESLGRLDLLINNASYLGPSPQPSLADYPLYIYRRVLEVNTIAPLALIQEALPLLRRAGGVVVNITSDAATEDYPGWGGYGSSKAALNQLSQVLAAEEDKVTVIWFDPGDMNTRMHQEAFPGEDISDRADPEDRVPALLTAMRRHESGHFIATKLLEAT